MDRIKIGASLLSADFRNLAEEVKRIEKAGADFLHVDVMDGHFVPNITMGPLVVRAVRPVTKLIIDAHLMIENPERFVEPFVKAGSDIIIFHIETSKDPEGLIDKIHKLGAKAGISLNPPTPLSAIEKVLDKADMVLVMSVNPGFSGQEFIPSAIDKIRSLRRIFKKDIAVDGGINEKTAKDVVAAGANMLAAGSYIYGAKDAKRAIDSLRG